MHGTADGRRELRARFLYKSPITFFGVLAATTRHAHARARSHVHTGARHARSPLVARTIRQLSHAGMYIAAAALSVRRSPRSTHKHASSHTHTVTRSRIPLCSFVGRPCVARDARHPPPATLQSGFGPSIRAPHTSSKTGPVQATPGMIEGCVPSLSARAPFIPIRNCAVQCNAPLFTS